MRIKAINNAVFDGIRKTINRFREQPFLYFTESDIHASLSKDIMENSTTQIFRKFNRMVGFQKNIGKTMKVKIYIFKIEYINNCTELTRRISNLLEKL
jgi:hypothetical protein